VFWVSAASIAKFEQAYKEVAKKLDIPGQENLDADVCALVCDWLSDESHGRWLMILDNADNRTLMFPEKGDLAKGDTATDEGNVAKRHMRDYLPLAVHEHGSLIITTRNRKLGGDLADGQDPIDVERFTAAEAEELLQSKIGQSQWDKATARELVEILEYIPLAITQAAAFVKQNCLMLGKYLRALKESDINLTRYLSEDLLDPRREKDIQSSVFLTWKLSFDQLRKEELHAANMLSLMAMLDRQGIPEILLCREETLDIDDTKAIGTLQAYSLIKSEISEGIYSMHRLVQLSTQEWLQWRDDLVRFQADAIDILSTRLPIGTHENKARCEALLPHALAVLRYDSSTVDVSTNRARALILYNIGVYEQSQGRYKEAYDHIKDSYEIFRKVLGTEALSTLNSLSSLASVLSDQGKYEQAEEIYWQELKLTEKVLGKEHPDTLTDMNNLAVVLSEQGRYKQAEEIHQQVLKLREKVLGKEHPDTLTGMNNLALVLSKQGKHKQAEEIH
jgi:tetratricopeptide (TPR) repeat protein